MEVLVAIAEGDSVHLHKLLGEPKLHFCVKRSSRPQNLWMLTCQNSLLQKLQWLLVVEKIQANCLKCGEVNSKKKLGGSSRRLTEALVGDELAYGRQASRINSTNSAKQINRSWRDIFVNLSQGYCQAISVFNNLRQFLDFLGQSSQLCTVSCCPTNKKFIGIRHWMKTAIFLYFKLIEIFTWRWARLSWLWNWNWLKVVVTTLQG